MPWAFTVPIFGFERGGGYLRIPDSARPACDASMREGAVLSESKVFVIGGASGRGSQARAAELGDIRLPFLRVALAPSANLDIEFLVSQRPRLGMFNALFAPASGSRLVTNANALAIVTPGAPAFSMPVAAIASVPVLVAFGAPIEDRSVIATSVPPAPVEERLIEVASAAPVEDRAITSRPLVPAPVEERAAVAVAHPEPPQAEVAFAPVQVASAAPVAVIVLTRPSAEARARPAVRPFAPVEISSPRPSLLQNMFDRRGGSFFM